MFARAPENAIESSSSLTTSDNSNQLLHNKFSSAFKSASPTALPTA